MKLTKKSNYDFASLFKRGKEASEIHERHTSEASVHEIKDDKMSIARSISVAQTDNRVLILFHGRISKSTVTNMCV